MVIWRFFKHNLEAFIWIAALITLAVQDPTCQHFSLCPLKNLGFNFCPGCGLGHSVSYVFRGDFASSLKAHPLGIFAILILVYRIFIIFKKYFINHRIIPNS